MTTAYGLSSQKRRSSLITLRSPHIKILLFGVVGVLVASILLWPIVGMAGIMSFDAPGSQDNPLTTLIFVWAITYPLPIVIGAIGVWRNRANSSLGVLYAYTSVALLSIAIPIVLFSLLGFFCGGNFACNT